MSPAASRPHFLNRWKHFNAGSSLAANWIAGRFSSPLTCSNQEPPGTARLSNFSQSKRLPSMIECPLPSNGATSRLAVCRTGRVFSPGRSTCAKNVMVLNTGPPQRLVGIAVPADEALDQLLHRFPAVDVHRRGKSGAALVVEEAGLEPAVIIGPRRVVGRHGCGLLLLLDRLAVDYLRVIMLEIDGVERLNQRQVEHGEIDCRLVANVAVVVPGVDRG